MSKALHIGPMEGLTTFPMRVFLSMTSKPRAATTPFLRVTKTFPNTSLPQLYAPELFRLRGLADTTVVPQLMACDADNFLRASDYLTPEITQVVELNCGCPTPNAAGRHAGSGILRDPEIFARTLERLCTALGPHRLAIKMRVGIDNPGEFPALMQAVNGLPLARLTIHGRTRRERYTGRSRWEVIQQAAKALPVPVYASGDVFNVADFERLLLAAPNVEGIFIGRGLMHNPWIFDDLLSGRSEGLSPHLLTLALTCYGMLQDLSMHACEKLLNRIADGKIGQFCGRELDAWRNAAQGLANVMGAPPTIVSSSNPAPLVTLSKVAFSRVKLLWAYMRQGIEGPLASPRLMRCRSLEELTAGICATS